MAIVIGDAKCFSKQPEVIFLTPDTQLIKRIDEHPNLPILLHNLAPEMKEAIRIHLPHRYLLDLDVKEILVGVNPAYAELTPSGTFLDASQAGWLGLLAFILTCRPIPVVITDSFSEILPLLEKANIPYSLFDTEALPYPLLRVVLSYLSDAELFSLLADDITLRKRLEGDLPFWRERFPGPFLPKKGETAAEHYLRQITERGSIVKGSERYLGLSETLNKAIEMDNLDLFLYLLQRGAVLRIRAHLHPATILPSGAMPSSETITNWYVYSLPNDILRYLALNAQVRDTELEYISRMTDILNRGIPTDAKELAFVEEGIQRISKEDVYFVLNQVPRTSKRFIRRLRKDLS